MKHLTNQQQETAMIAMEEMAELTQVLSKLIRFGYTADKADDLIQEMGDVLLLHRLLQKTFGIEDNSLDDAMLRKQHKLVNWSGLYE